MGWRPSLELSFRRYDPDAERWLRDKFLFPLRSGGLLRLGQTHDSNQLGSVYYVNKPKLSAFRTTYTSPRGLLGAYTEFRVLLIESRPTLPPSLTPVTYHWKLLDCNNPSRHRGWFRLAGVGQSRSATQKGNIPFHLNPANRY